MMGFGGVGGVAAARSSRKYYLDRVLTVLLSFPLAKPKYIRDEIVSTRVQSWFGARSVAAQKTVPTSLQDAAMMRATFVRDLNTNLEDFKLLCKSTRSNDNFAALAFNGCDTAMPILPLLFMCKALVHECTHPMR